MPQALRRIVPGLLTLLAAAACAAAALEDGGPQAPPNVIVILVDDLGYADLGIHGSQEVSTPEIDALFRSGVRFTNAYVNQPTCAPTRAGLLTGRYPHRSGYVNATGPPLVQEKERRGLPLSEVLLPQVLTPAGYATGAIGKWHLGIVEKFRPTRRGFDEFFGHLGGGHEYFEWQGPLGGPILRGEEEVDGEGYLPHAFTEEAVSFIERNAEGPFFLYLAPNLVHSPFDVPPEYMEPYADVEDETRRALLGMIAAMDTMVGEVIDALEELEIREETLVFFLNDNGGPRKVASNAPFKGAKWDMTEGGIRVPFAMSWPGTIEAGGVYDGVVSAMDVFPTVASVAGASVPQGVEIDGVDLMPFLRGEREDDPHDVLYFQMKHQHAIRRGDMKLYLTGPPLDPVRCELYDLSTDVGESENLAAENPELVEALRAEWLSWHESMARPLF